MHCTKLRRNSRATRRHCAASPAAIAPRQPTPFRRASRRHCAAPCFLGCCLSLLSYGWQGWAVKGIFWHHDYHWTFLSNTHHDAAAAAAHRRGGCLTISAGRVAGRAAGPLCAAAVTWPFKPMRVTGSSSHHRHRGCRRRIHMCVYSREMNFGPWFDKCEKFRLKKDPPRLWLLLFALSALASLLSSANFSVTSVAARAPQCAPQCPPPPADGGIM